MQNTTLAARSRIGSVVALAILSLFHPAVFAGSAQWSNAPAGNDWHTPNNWTPDHVPNSLADIGSLR
jgi:hypothetical protein